MILTAVLILSFFLAAGVLHVTGMGSHFKSILTCNQALHMFVFERSFPDTRKTLHGLNLLELTRGCSKRLTVQHHTFSLKLLRRGKRI